jgi:CelD/BcsL family acetyltransferase involved in cellulose biosynthesis
MWVNLMGEKMITSESGTETMDTVVTGKYMGTLSIEEISDVEKFRALREPWNALLQRSSDNNLFLTWEWLFNWWQYYGRDKKLRIIIIKEGDQIVGIIPLMENKYRQGFVSIKVLENLCSEECDYSGIILAENTHEVLALLVDYLAKVTKDENLIVRMYHIPENSAFLTSLREQYPSFSKYLYLDEKPSSFCSYILLPPTWEEYLHTLSRNSRRNIMRKLQYISKDHVVESKKITDDNDLQEKLKILFELHQKKWGRESKFNKPEARAFYTGVSQALRRNGWLNFSYLNVDGKTLSLLWAFSYNSTFWGMTNAVDVEYAEYSAGSVHLSKTIEDSIKDGLKKFDFLKGEEGYKGHWTDNKSNNIKITMTQNNVKGRLLAGLLQSFIKIDYARQRSLGENISLLLKKMKPQVKTNNENKWRDSSTINTLGGN